MFDIGFSELVMIGLVSLIVIGPERLPKVARIAGYWIGKSRSMMASVKAEIQQEFQQEELRQILKDQLDLQELHTAINETTEATEALKVSLIESLEDTKIEKSQVNESK
ncbi:MAG: twin-arginine translocase subunit TatB [Methylococcales bacterium]|nr:MAG: twin-arginine translocase subunit TatB [Methylococcales bacterium]